MTIEEALQKEGLTLPDAPKAAGNYVPCVQVGNLVFMSGVLSITSGDEAYAGKIGTRTYDVAYGYQAARACVLNALAVLKANIRLEKVERIVQVQGFVNGVDGFEDAAAVINGASDLLGTVMGDAGRHARAAVSVNGLPLGASVEIAVIAQIQQ